MKKTYKKLSYFGIIVVFIGTVFGAGYIHKKDTELKKNGGEGVTVSHGITLLNTDILIPGVTGYGGVIPLEITINEQEIIHQIKILNNQETPSFIRWIKRAKFLDHWIGHSPKEALAQKVDTITGATMSTSAMKKTINGSLAHYLHVSIQKTAPQKIPFKRLIPGMIVVLLGVFFALRKPKKKIFRTIQLVLNVAVLGFWCGSFISLSNIVGRLHGGPFNPAMMIVALMVVTAILLPLFKRKQSYCTWVCPFGAAQELSGKLSKKKIKLPKKMLQNMIWVRRVLLVLLVISLWISPGLMLIHYEPFTAFWFQTASPIVLGVAGVSLFLSIFINRFWCRCLCPTGEILSWFDRLR